MPIVLTPAVSGVWRWALVDADGIEHPMNGEDDISVVAGPSGHLMPPVAVVDRELPIAAGAQLQGVRVAARELDLPLIIQGSSLSGLVNRHEQLLSWVDPTRGTVLLRVTRPDDTRREIEVMYLGGLEGDEQLDNGVMTWWRGVASFRAHDPFWRDVVETSQSFVLNATPGSWFPLVFPILLAGSQVFATTTIHNTGTAEAWPVWTITGPGKDPVVRNLSTGKHFGISHTLGSGEQVTIDTAPLAANPVRDGAGNNLFGQRTVGSERWSLKAGTNVIQVELPNATSASSVRLAYRRRWLRR